MPADTHHTAERGRRVVEEELRRRGVVATAHKHGGLTLLEMHHPADERLVRLRVKTRTAGSWQASIRDGSPEPAHPETYWVFVELEREETAGFFIVPDAWIRRDIYEAHQKYLRSHGGQRPVADNSTHHAIQPARITQWRNRWDLLGL